MQLVVEENPPTQFAMGAALQYHVSDNEYFLTCCDLPTMRQLILITNLFKCWNLQIKQYIFLSRPSDI